MQKITPCLWFNGQAEEAMNYYTSIFKDASVGNIMRYGEAGPGEPGSVLTATFTLFGQEFTALNGGPAFSFTPAISFFINCETQEEVDEYWDKLSAGGKTSQCGWLEDKFGISWQVAPSILGAMLRDKDAAKAKRVMEAMLKMTKLDIKTLQAAHDG
jgi:predicted 3-demethylubiquinone-9 3-methyltransferase (glyoxalase superfamily)